VSLQQPCHGWQVKTALLNQHPDCSQSTHTSMHSAGCCRSSWVQNPAAANSLPPPTLASPGPALASIQPKTGVRAGLPAPTQHRTPTKPCRCRSVETGQHQAQGTKHVDNKKWRVCHGHRWATFTELSVRTSVQCAALQATLSGETVLCKNRCLHRRTVTSGASQHPQGH
jgi:hypothetical protein